MHFYLSIFLLTFYIGHISSNRVLELSDRFLEVRNNGVWMVMFYAPWCGHCKNLEPIWSQVAQSLVDTDIRVGRLDCTRFTNVATEFSVSGFPTILFIKGHKTVEYKGDRARTDIVEFARRMDGPAVRHFASCDQLKDLRLLKKVFFLYIDGGKPQGNEKLKDEFTKVASEFQSVMHFYTAPTSCIAMVEGIDVPTEPSVYVCKDNSCFKYEEELVLAENITLHEWVNKERFPAFIKVTTGNFHQVIKTRKNLALAVLEENQIGGITLKMQEFRDVAEAIAISNKDRYHKHFVFGWLGQPELANSIAMKLLSVPSFIVINTTNYEYHLPTLEEDEKIPTPQTIILFLDQVVNNSSPAYGGDTYFCRLYRTYFEARTSLYNMWRGNPVLTAVILGLPLGILSIICYTNCCSDILEAGDDDEESESDTRHPKRE